jgi:hypothetical protein
MVRMPAGHLPSPPMEVQISDLELFCWKAIAIIVDICGARKSERNILNKLSRNLSHVSMTEFCGKSNVF